MIRGGDAFMVLVDDIEVGRSWWWVVVEAGDVGGDCIDCDGSADCVDRGVRGDGDDGDDGDVRDSGIDGVNVMLMMEAAVVVKMVVLDGGIWWG